MKNTRSLILGFALASLSVFAAGCGKKEDNDRQVELQQNNKVQSGTYASERCFMNGIATTVLATRYSMAEITLNEDGTGSAHYRNFSDSTCTTPTNEETLTFSEISVVPIAGLSVMRFKQSGEIVNPNWWIPVSASNGGYGFDVDATDGESGPYLFEPTPTQLASFGANAGQAVAFKKQ